MDPVSRPVTAAGTDADPAWLRTGGLGLVDGKGELSVTGRRRGLVIVAGRNHLPVGPDQTAEAADPAGRVVRACR